MPTGDCGALEDDVLEAEVEPEPLAQRLVAEADREERLPRGEQLVDGRAEVRDLRVVAVARVARARARR